MTEIFFDTETTGLEIGACVIELAAIMVDNGKIIDTFHQYAKPYRAINPAAQATHGITMEFLRDKPEEKVMLKDFLEWIIGSGAKVVYAYNAQFDVRILNDRLRMDNLKQGNFFDRYKVVDVAIMAKKAIKDGVIPKSGRKWNQEYVASCLGIEYDAHSAIEDVKAMYKIYEILKTKVVM